MTKEEMIVILKEIDRKLDILVAGQTKMIEQLDRMIEEQKSYTEYDILNTNL